METKNNWKAWLYLAPALILMALFTFYPLINTLLVSFLKNYNYVSGASEGFTFENFGIVLGITPIQTGGTPVYVTNFIRYALPNTLIITFVTVPISIILALFIAILINSIKVLRGLFQTIFFLPYVTNVIAVGMVFSLIFSTSGVFNSLFNLRIDWIGYGSNRVTALFILCIYIIWTQLPYKILIFLSGLQGIDKQYYDAAKLDGAGKLKTTFKITMPLLSPQILYIMITSFISAFKEYNAVVGLFNRSYTGSPNTPDLYTVVYYIYDQLGTNNNNVSYASAGAVVLFAIILVFTLLQMWASKKRVHY